MGNNPQSHTTSVTISGQRVDEQRLIWMNLLHTFFKPYLGTIEQKGCFCFTPF